MSGEMEQLVEVSRMSPGDADGSVRSSPGRSTMTRWKQAGRQIRDEFRFRFWKAEGALYGKFVKPVLVL